MKRLKSCRDQLWWGAGCLSPTAYFFSPCFGTSSFSHPASSSEIKRTLLESSSGDQRGFHPFLHPCFVHPFAGLAKNSFFSFFSCLWGCLELQHPSPSDAFNAEIHPVVPVPFPSSWVLGHLRNTHNFSQNQLWERVFAQLFIYFFYIFPLYKVKDLFIDCKWPLRSCFYRFLSFFFVFN